ncbi:hypothetical protein R6Q59_018907 [Mikania micrantha]
MAWRAHRAKLSARFKDIGGSKDPTKAKVSPPYNISKEDWEYLCDMWCENCKKEDRGLSKPQNGQQNGSKSTIRYHFENEHDLYSSSGQINTWRHTHWDEEKGWLSEESAATYEDMIKLRKQHSVELMRDKLFLEKVETLKETCAIMQKILVEKNIMSLLLGLRQDDTSESDENVDE